MAKDAVYTNGVIAVKEQALWGTKLQRLAEGSAEEAFRALVEGGFGKGCDAASVYEYEALLAADERDTDAFIREYAPSQAELAYLLSPRDFHNAKALVKALVTDTDASPLLAPEGAVSVERLETCLREEDFEPLPAELGGAMQAALALRTEEGEVSGAELGLLFERALFRHLAAVCKRNKFLRSLVRAKSDMTDLLTAARAPSQEAAEKSYLGVGALSAKELSAIFTENQEAAETALRRTGYPRFVELLFEAKRSGSPFTQAERLLSDYEIETLAEHKFELSRNQPFLYYVFRRRAENANVRILLACLLSGRSEQEIKRRLRTV